MKKIYLLVVLLLQTMFVGAQTSEQNWLNTVDSERKLYYLVSTRPLADLYSHPLASSLNQLLLDDGYVYALYLGKKTGTGTSSEQLMYTVDQDIQRMLPDYIILDEVDASGYLMQLLPEKFHSRTTIISKSNLKGIPDSVNRVPIANMANTINSLMTDMSIFPSTYYIFYDSSGLASKESFLLRKSLNAYGLVKAYEVHTLEELTDILLEIQTDQKGVIINNMMTLRTQEFNAPVRMERIKQEIVRRNKRHISIGFNYLPDAENEALIFEIDYRSFALDYYFDKQNLDAGVDPMTIQQKIDNRRPYGFKLIVNKTEIEKLLLKTNLIAALDQIDVLVE